MASQSGVVAEDPSTVAASEVEAEVAAEEQLDAGTAEAAEEVQETEEAAEDAEKAEAADGKAS
jgi:hypothetical protein